MADFGATDLDAFRKDVREQEGASFNLKRFHDNLLAHGAPPIRVLREILLKNPASWPQVL